MFFEAIISSDCNIFMYQQIIQIALALGSLNLALFPVVFATLFWTLKPRAVFWSLVVVLVSVAGLGLMKSLDPQTAALSLPIALVFLLLFHFVLPRPANVGKQQG